MYKNYLIYTFSLVVLFLIGYIIMQKPEVENTTKTKIKTIVKEKIVYQDSNECNEKKLTGNFVISPSQTTSVKKEKHTISKSTDSRHRFIISLVTNEKIDDTENRKNIILNGSLKNENYQSIFIMKTNQTILKQNDISFKIEDKHFKTTAFGDATCLQDVLEEFIYKVELEIIDNNINCMVYQDRKILEDNKSTTKSKEEIIPKFKLQKELEQDLNEENLEKKLEFQKGIEKFLKKDGA